MIEFIIRIFEKFLFIKRLKKLFRLFLLVKQKI